MTPENLENGAQHAMKWRPISWKMVPNVHVVLGSHMRPCKPSALDLTIANTWVRLQQSSQGGSL